MASKTEQQASGGDSLKLGLSALIVVGGIAGFYYFGDESLLLRVVGLLAVVIVAVAIGFQTLVGRKTYALAQDAVTETRKVVWPTGAEALQTTLIVAAMVVIVGILLWLLDMFLGWGFQLLTGTGS